MKKLLRSPITLLIHIALAIIVAGAMVTHFCGIQGKVTLREKGVATDYFDKSSGPGNGEFPFKVSLERRDIIFYPGTTTPMDYRSTLLIDGHRVQAAMNKVAEYEGWRFYQSAMGKDSSVLTVSHDPWGTGITYCGYALLGLSMTGFFFSRKTMWRQLFRQTRLAGCLLMLLSASLAPIVGRCDDSENLKVMQRPLARNFGKIYVYWNERVTPLQTMAYDITNSLYGTVSYKDMTPEQVLSGWLFYYDEWLRDYETSHPLPSSEKERKKENDRKALIRWLGSGSAFRIYPYRSAAGNLEWLSLTERRPSKMELGQWTFMTVSMRDIASDLALGKNVEANDKISRLKEGQIRYAGKDMLPSVTRFEAELFYNRYVRLFPLGIILIIFGGFIIFRALRVVSLKARFVNTESAGEKIFKTFEISGILAATLCLGGILVLRGIIGGHWPLSNGQETMLFMGFAAVAGAIFVRPPLLRGSLVVVSSMAVLVAAMSSRTPRIGSLMPVLASPLLSIHVMLVMLSYVLFVLMSLLSGIALSKGRIVSGELARINRIILVPALFLLTAGIFVGAVWANQSWGRYWGWDPKETCALVTMLIYAVPVHRATLKIFSNDRILHLYLLLAILSVLFTYFGANYLLPGLHSYA